MAVVTGRCHTESGVDGSGNGTVSTESGVDGSGTVSYRERRRWQW